MELCECGSLETVIELGFQGEF